MVFFKSASQHQLNHKKMAESKKKTKRTKKVETETGDKKDETKKQMTNRVIWLFAAHDKVARHGALQLFNPLNPLCAELRKALGLKLDSCILPVFPETWNRLDLISHLEDADFPKDTVLVVVGQHEDFRKDKVAEFKGHEYLFVHPTERNYYLISGEQGPGTYQKANKRKEKMEETLDQIFQAV